MHLLQYLEDLFNKLVTISKKLVDKVELTDEENFLINSPAIVGYQKIFNALITVQSKHRTQQHELNKIDLSKVAENSFTNNNKDNKLGSLYIGSTNSFTIF
jgi:hypothetical protein